MFVRLFVESLVEDVAEWFQNLKEGCITGWNDLKVKFLGRFQLVVDTYKLLLNFFQIQMKKDESMKDFVDRFNRCVGKIPQACQPNESKQLCVFIAALQTEIKFLLICKKLQNLEDAQEEAIKVDDDMFLSGMKCINECSVDMPHSEIYFHNQNLKPIEKL